MEEEAKNQVDEEQEAVLEQERVEETESQQKDIADGVENESILKEKSKKKQKSAPDFSGLSDDEIYAKVETERLLKRKKKSKILTLVALCFTFVLAVCLICFSTIPVGLYPKCISKDYEIVTFYPGTRTPRFAFEDGTKGAKEFDKLLDKSFSEVYLTAIFSGKLGEYKLEEKYATNIEDAIDDFVSSNTYYVCFEYGQSKTVLDGSGKKFVSKQISAKDEFDGTLTYDTIYLQVNDKEGFQDTTVYLSINNYPDSTKNKTVKITVRANTYQIYNAWSDLFDVGQAV